MKRIKKYVYEFNINEELTIYNKIGNEKSPYQNYCEWYNYVYKRYGNSKYTESTLENFVHYLNHEKNIIMSRKEMWSGCIMPLFTVVISIVYTFVFSVVR